MKKIKLCLPLLFIFISFQLFSVIITKEVSAYKYSQYSETPFFEVYLMDLNGTRIEPSDIFIPDESILEVTPLFQWGCMGNTTKQVTITFTLEPLKLVSGTNRINYDIKFSPQGTKIGTSSLSPTVIGPFPYGTNSFYYNETTQPSETTLNSNSNNPVTTSIRYQAITPKSSSSGTAVTPIPETINHWIRTGIVYIHLLNVSPETTATGDYQATMTIGISGV